VKRKLPQRSRTTPQRRPRQPREAASNSQPDGAQSLRDALAERVREGVHLGLIAFNPESALAIARDPSRPPERLSPNATPEDIIQWRETNAEWFGRRRTVEDLSFLLRDGDLQCVALRELDVPLVEPDVQSAFVAADLSMEMALISWGHGAPQQVWDRAKPVIEATLRQRTGITAPSVPPWFLMLVNVFEAGGHLVGATRPRDRVDLVLGTLRAGAADVPSAMLGPCQSHMRAAERFLATARVNTVKTQFQPRAHSTRRPAAAQTGKLPSPWTVARKFAECFGIRGIPTRQRDAKRGKK